MSAYYELGTRRSIFQVSLPPARAIKRIRRAIGESPGHDAQSPFVERVMSTKQMRIEGLIPGNFRTREVYPNIRGLVLHIEARQDQRDPFAPYLLAIAQPAEGGCLLHLALSEKRSGQLLYLLFCLGLILLAAIPFGRHMALGLSSGGAIAAFALMFILAKLIDRRKEAKERVLIAFLATLFADVNWQEAQLQRETAEALSE
jgi:hypothetical protein